MPQILIVTVQGLAACASGPKTLGLPSKLRPCEHSQRRIKQSTGGIQPRIYISRMARPRRRLLAGGVAAAFLTIASALQPALRVRTPALARVTRPPVASAYTVLRAAANDDDTAVADEEAASDEADEAVAEEEETEEEEEEEAEDPNAEIKAEIATLEAQLKEKRLELSRANGAAAEASEAGYYRIVADVSTYKKNAAKQQESVAEVAKADAFRIFDKVLLAFEEA